MSISNDLQTKNVALRASQRGSTKDLLRALIESLDHNPDLINVKDMEAIAVRLSEVAQRPKRGKQPWGWRMLRNVLNEKIDASQEFVSAVYALGANTDGTPKLVAMARQVMVLAVGKVEPGAVILGDSQACGNPYCSVKFVPRSGNQVYCSEECRKQDYRRKRHGRA